MSTPEPGQQPPQQADANPYDSPAGAPSGPARSTADNPYAVAPGAGVSSGSRPSTSSGWASGTSTSITFGAGGGGPRVTTRSYGTTESWKIIAIVGFVFAFIFSIVGLIVSIVARRQAKKAGAVSKLATAGIIVSIVRLLLDIVAVVLIVVTLAGGVTLFSGIVETCAELGPGTHVRDGVTYTCS